MSLVEVLVSIGILAIVMAGMTSYMTSQQREIKGLTEILAKLDVEKLLIAALADGAVCSAELSNTALNASAPYAINATNSASIANTIINLSSLHAGPLATSPILVQTGVAPSPMSNSLLVNTITIENLQATGVPDQYLAQMTFTFNGPLVRALKPVVLQKVLTTNPADPVNAKKITGCLGVPTGAGGVPAMNSGLMGSYCAPNTYCNRNSGLALCYVYYTAQQVPLTNIPFSKTVYVNVTWANQNYIAGPSSILNECNQGLNWLN